jgi:hypothetical protein
MQSKGHLFGKSVRERRTVEKQRNICQISNAVVPIAQGHLILVSRQITIEPV